MRPAAKTAPVAPAPRKEPKIEVKRLFETPIQEPSPEEFNPLARLLFDANVYLNGYLEALKASSGDSRPQNFNRKDAKGIGAA